MVTIKKTVRVPARTTADASRSQSVLPGVDKQELLTRSQSDLVLVSPFVVLCDNNEGTPYYFTGLRADANKQYRPLAVQREKVSLNTGDYSIKGLEHLVTVERKTLEDLFGTILSGRERFRAEHERMAEMIAAGGSACVAIEASLEQALYDPPAYLTGTPEVRQNKIKMVHRVSLSWPQRYGVTWFWWSNRRLSEESTYRYLEQFHKHQLEKAREEKRAAKK